jgi:hypothetical protein
MALWNGECNSETRFLDRQDFGARLTSVNATSQLRRATERWGPYGGDWGLRNLRYELIRGQEVREHKDKKTKAITRTLVGTPDTIIALSLVAEFFWPGGQFDMAADIPYSSRHGEDCYKSLLTVVRSKSFMTLGFNADIPLKDSQASRPAASRPPVPRERGGDAGNSTNGPDLSRAKANVLRDVRTRLAAVGSPVQAIGLIRYAAKTELGHDVIQTRQELERVHKAICTGQYDLKTGRRKATEPEPQPEPELADDPYFPVPDDEAVQETTQ